MEIILYCYRIYRSKCQVLEIKNANINSGVELNRSAGVWGESEGYVCEEEEPEEEEEEEEEWKVKEKIGKE